MFLGVFVLLSASSLSVDAFSSPFANSPSALPTTSITSSSTQVTYRLQDGRPFHHQTIRTNRLSPLHLHAVAEKIAEASIATSVSSSFDNATSSDILEKPLSKTTTSQPRPTLTVVAGGGARITSVSTGVNVDQDFSGGKSFVEKKDSATDQSIPSLVVTPGRGARITSVSSGVVVDEDGVFGGEIRCSDDDTNTDDDQHQDQHEQDTAEYKDESNDSADESVDSFNDTDVLAKANLLRRAGLVGGANKSSRSKGRSSLAKSHVNKNNRQNTSGRAVRTILSTVRTAAGAAAVKKSASTSGDGTTSDENKPSTSSKWQSAIQSTVSDLVQRQSVKHSSNTQPKQVVTPPPGTTTMGVLGEPIQASFPPLLPSPGTLLVNGSSNNERFTARFTPRISIRASVPHSADDTHIANLRLSVFSRFDEEQQHLFRSRSLEVLNIRRRRGAVVLVAEWPDNGTSDGVYRNEMSSRIENGSSYGEGRYNSNTITTTKQQTNTASTQKCIIGSAECSHQEFRGTMLGSSRPKGTLLYVTEVAVNPDVRRCGAGAMLMKGVDQVAALRNVESIYLHVDVTNRAACAMYEKAGYEYLDSTEPIYAQFTASLNLHDGAKHGRRHYLLCKHRKKATWLDDDAFLSSLGLL